MLDTIKSLPTTIAQLAQDYEQGNLQDKAKAVLHSCYENYESEGPDSPYTQRIQRLTRNCQQVQEQKVRFHIFKAEGEAFALGSGDICIFTSLMDKLNDDELMFILGHEIAHVINEDALWGIRMAWGAELTAYIATFTVSRLPWGKAASLATKMPLIQKFLRITGKRLANQLATRLVTGVSRICYSRSQEYRADQFGIRFLHTHGHRVEAAATALEKLRGDTIEGRIEKLTNDHPDINKRIAELNRIANVLLA